MTCRLYRTNDEAALIHVIDFVCAESKWMSTKKFVPTDQWNHALLNPGCTRHALFVVGEKDEIAGWCRLFPEKCLLSENVWELGIGLLPEYRNRKIGQGLLETAIVWASNQSCQSISLTTNENNHVALHLFNKIGFKVVNKQGSILSMSLSDYRVA